MKRDEGNTERFFRHAGRHRAWYASGTVITACLAVAGFILTHYTIPAWDGWRAKIVTAEQQAAQVEALKERLDRNREICLKLREDNAALQQRINKLELQIAHHR